MLVCLGWGLWSLLQSSPFLSAIAWNQVGTNPQLFCDCPSGSDHAPKKLPAPTIPVKLLLHDSVAPNLRQKSVWFCDLRNGLFTLRPGPPSIALFILRMIGFLSWKLYAGNPPKFQVFSSAQFVQWHVELQSAPSVCCDGSHFIVFSHMHASPVIKQQLSWGKTHWVWVVSCVCGWTQSHNKPYAVNMWRSGQGFVGTPVFSGMSSRNEPLQYGFRMVFPLHL